MWAWNMIAGKPAVQSASVTGIGGGSGSFENYGGDAAMADMKRGGAFQRRSRRRRSGVRRRRAHQSVSTIGIYAAAQRRAYRSRKTSARRHARLKTRVIGTQASTGKRIFQGKGGGRYTRGARGNRNYL